MAIILKSGNRETVVRQRDISALAAAQIAGIPVEATCGGAGSCGKCSVFLEEGDYEIFGEKIRVEAGERREELACQTFFRGPDARVVIPSAAGLESEGARIETEISLPKFMMDPVVRRDAGATKAPLGLAVDIGTSTVAAALVNLETGVVIDRATRFNQQALRGDDVASRIAQCESDANVRTLQQLVIEHTINPMAVELCDRNAITRDEIRAIAVAGNTVMSHLFLGLSPFSIGRLPFTPMARKFAEVPASRLGLHAHRDAPIHVVPCISGYVGGDIVADLRVTEFASRKGAWLLIDIGTNGEMAFIENGKIFACATAAGPAFEGAGLLHGCRAVAGAIEHIEYDASLDFRCATIGGGAALGFCGSAAIDFIACGMDAGLINMMGRFDLDMLKACGRYQQVRVRHGFSHGCVVVDAAKSATGEALVITEFDVSQIMKAKAAIYAGLKTMLQLSGCHPRDLDGVILAGGFAKHIRLPNAIRIGLLPALPVGQFEIAGNGSLAGAVLSLLDTTSRDEFNRLMDVPEVIELNLTKDFATYFSDALALPYLEPEEFELTKE